MNKLISVLLCTLILSFTNITNAKVSENEVALGGLFPRTNISNAYDIYGNPDLVDDTRFYWGKGFKIDINNRRDMVSINTTANNGIATPSGLHVGCTVNDVYKIYGKPDSVSGEKM